MNQNNSKNVVTEIAQFNTMGDYNDDDFIKIIDDLEKDFHMDQQGYIDTELIKGKEKNSWIMIQHWRTMDEAKESSKKFVQSPQTEKFRMALDPRSVSLYFTDQIKSWQA